jgi:hypothetical protein
MMTRDTNPSTEDRMTRYLIIATDGTGQDVQCFTWIYGPEAGIERAKREAIEFGRPDLHNFRAEEIRG